MRKGFGLREYTTGSLTFEPSSLHLGRVISLLAAGIILALLLLHWIVEFNAKPSKNAGPETPAHTKLQIRVAGRHFMLQNTMLIALIAFTALIFSKIVSVYWRALSCLVDFVFVHVGTMDIPAGKSGC